MGTKAILFFQLIFISGKILLERLPQGSSCELVFMYFLTCEGMGRGRLKAVRYATEGPPPFVPVEGLADPADHGADQRGPHPHDPHQGWQPPQAPPHHRPCQ